jgi:hypothetical protein
LSVIAGMGENNRSASRLLSQPAAAGAIPSAGAGRWPARVTPRSMNAYQWAV